ncbi:hypothetical protein BpHYR1_006556 [Brachionus plicatilis]|uniref:Uncharacterized protein n=1 Tax=Brachionus plicatilis TaxID=10195 RepID=A0A3M7SZK6_BRAPC|nr:hypothetical protein BpHYR1_006556 [Brachionus plicatilis]
MLNRTYVTNQNIESEIKKWKCCFEGLIFTDSCVPILITRKILSCWTYFHVPYSKNVAKDIPKRRALTLKDRKRKAASQAITIQKSKSPKVIGTVSTLCYDFVEAILIDIQSTTLT